MPRKSALALRVALVLATLVSASLCDLRLSNTPSIDGSYTIAQEWFDASSALTSDLAGPIVVHSSSANVTGAIVMIDLPEGLFRLARSDIFKIQSLGALAAVMSCPESIENPGRIMFQTQKGTVEDVLLPIFSMGFSDWHKIAKGLGSNASGLIPLKGNTNYWMEAMRHPGTQVWFAVVAAVDLATFIFGLVRLFQYAKIRGCGNTVAIWALGLNVAGLFIGTFSWVVDPYGTRQLWPNEFNGVLSNLSVMFIFSSDLLVVLFWLEILTLKKLKAVVNLRRLRIPYFIITGYFLVAAVCSAVFCVVFPQRYQFSSLFPVFNIVAELILIIVSVFVVIAKIRASEKAQKDERVLSARIHRMNAHMIAMGTLGIASCICLGTFIALGNSPWGYMIMMGISSLVICSVTLNQIFMFQLSTRYGNNSRTLRSSKSKIAASTSHPERTSTSEVVSSVDSDNGNTTTTTTPQAKDHSTASS